MTAPEPMHALSTSSRADGAAEHIALLLHDFSAGGSERIAIRLANRWAETGRRVTILCGTEEGPLRALVSGAVAVLSVRPALPRGILSRLRLGRAVAHLVRIIQPDMIFAPGNFHLPVIRAMAGALGHARPLIACKLSNPLARPDRGALARRAFTVRSRITTEVVDLLVAMSPGLRDEARAILRRDDIACIAEPNLDGTVPPPIHALAERTLLCIGRLVPQKRFQLALRAFALIPPAEAATLKILGDGPDRATLVAEAKRLGIADRVTFTGHVARVAPYLAQARLLLCTSRYEGYPAVLVEALAAGIPIVTTDCSPAIGEIMTHPSFGIVSPADPAMLAGAIIAQLDRDRPDITARAILTEAHLIGPIAQTYLALFDRAVSTRMTV